MNKNQRGFSAIEALLIIIVLGLIGFAGWFIWQKNNTENKTTDKPQATQNKPKQEIEKAFVIPSNYTTYSNDDLGFSFAYPQKWGKLAPPIDPNFSYELMSAYVDDQPLGTSRLQGWLGFTTTAVDSFKMSLGKYDVAVSPEKANQGYIWKVSDTRGLETDKKVGDIYTPKVIKGASGATIYDFSWEDEGAHHSRWVFAAGDRFVTVGLPALLHGEMASVPADDLKAYNAIAKNIQDSIVIK